VRTQVNLIVEIKLQQIIDINLI